MCIYNGSSFSDQHVQHTNNDGDEQKKTVVESLEWFPKLRPMVHTDDAYIGSPNYPRRDYALKMASFTRKEHESGGGFKG